MPILIEQRLNVSGFLSNEGIRDIFISAYTRSSSMRTAVDAWLERNPTRNIVINYYAGVANAPVNQGMVRLDPAYINSFSYVSTRGVVVSFTIESALVHEIGHAVSGWRDNDSFQNLFGTNVANTNSWYRELGIQERSSYNATNNDTQVLNAGDSYTDGNLIRNTIVDRKTATTSPLYLNSLYGGIDFDTQSINLTASGVTGSSLIIGGDCENFYTGTASRDWIYGNGGNDLLNGGRGNDIIYGGSGSDLINGGFADGSLRSTDGIDIAGYADLGPRLNGVEILLSDTTPNSIFSGSPLARYATYVQDRDSPGDIDMLVSIERVNGSRGDDVFRVTSFNPERLADPATGQGGLARVDLGTQASNGIRQGDRFDASGFAGPLLISSGLSPEGSPTGYVRSLDTQGGELKIDGVEWYVGSQGDDIFNIYGDGRTIEGGPGNDRIRAYGDGHYLFGGAGDDTYLLEGFENYLSDFEGRSTIRITGWDNTSISGDDTGDRVTVIGQRNVVMTGPGADIVHLSGGQNNITLGAGNDRLVLDDTGGIDYSHVNLVFGGAGDDVFVIRPGGPATVFDGGADNDTYDVRQLAGVSTLPREGYIIDYHRGDGFDRLLTKIPAGQRNPHFTQDGDIVGAPADITGIARIRLTDYYHTQIRLEWNAQLLDSWTDGSGDIRQYLYRGTLVMFDKGTGQAIFDFGITYGATDSAELGNQPASISFMTLPQIQLADLVNVQHIEGLPTRYGYIEVSQGGSGARTAAADFFGGDNDPLLFNAASDSRWVPMTAFGESAPTLHDFSYAPPMLIEHALIA